MKIRLFRFCLLLAYSAGFCFFYYRYVPLVKPFQIALIPFLIMAIVITALNVEGGLFFFIFSFPLINNLPYFFGITLDIPHAPTALVLFLALFLGWLINRLLSGSKFNFHFSIAKPLLLLSLVVLASAVITFLRYSNFFPFASDRINELVVNVNGVRAGGALMSIVFASLNYLTGFGLFLLLTSPIKDQKRVNQVLRLLSLALLVSLAFAFVQRYSSAKIGNTPFWLFKDQINSTFKDPNSFGAFLAAFFPVLLGMAFSFRKKWRLFSIGLIICTLYVFPWTGLRSGFLALFIALVAFSLVILASARISRKKKIALATSFALIIVFFLVAVFAGQTKTILAKRLAWSLNIAKGKITLGELFTEKFRFWKAASSMVKDYPLTGVGAGAYIVELPNYSKLMGLSYRWTDSAENYFFQVSSELGLIGLLLILWLFYEIIKQMRRSWADPGGDDLAGSSDRPLIIGIILGVLAIFINFLFHSFIGGYEVIYLFWILVAMIFLLSRVERKTEGKIKLGPKFKMASWALVLIFGAAHLWNSTRSLSLQSRTEKFGLKQDFGLYPLEKDERRFSFQWAKKSAGTEIDILGPLLVLPLLASHPDIERRPVRVQFYLADRNYRKKVLLKEISLNRKEWQDVELPASEFLGQKIHLVIETSRAWLPYKLGIPDARKLAVALGEAWFRYPAELPLEKIRSIQKISSANWSTPEGKATPALYSNGISQIKFKSDNEGAALRLFLRGQKALNLGPIVIIRLDGQTLGKTMLVREDWTAITLCPDLGPGEHVLEVEFTNDLHKPELRQDRNVFLGDLEVISLN